MKALLVTTGVAAAAAAAIAVFWIAHTRQIEPAAAQAHPGARSITPQPAKPAPMPGRIQLSPGQVREAYKAGLIDRPIKSVLDVPARMSYGDYRWNDEGVPAGPVWIRVDLRSQLISVFRSGHEIGTAVILYGTDGYPTPTGKFPILAKMKDHRSITYGNAPMPYTLRLTPDGVSIHGSNVRWGFASHGCIGVPVPFAAKLFGVANKGDEVFIVQSKQPAPRTA